MFNRRHKLSVVRQAKLLGFSHGSIDYSPRAVSDDDMVLMRRINELHLDYPFAGSRMSQRLLKAEGLQTGRLHVAMLMKKMGIEAIYRRPDTSKPASGHEIKLNADGLRASREASMLDTTMEERHEKLAICGEPRITNRASRDDPDSQTPLSRASIRTTKLREMDLSCISIERPPLAHALLGKRQGETS